MISDFNSSIAYGMFWYINEENIPNSKQSPRIYNLSPSEVSCDNYGIGTNTEVIRDRWQLTVKRYHSAKPLKEHFVFVKQMVCLDE